VRLLLADTGVQVAGGDLHQPPGGPYDVIIVEGAVDRASSAWVESLAPGGRLALIERTGPLGKAQIYLKTSDGVAARRTTFDATPPFIAGFEPQPGFVF
jgi:protein-L-isoaspartate(D-aspartate) O-methyltransferase